MSLNLLSKFGRATAAAPPPRARRPVAEVRPAASGSAMNVFARALVDRGGLPQADVHAALDQARVRHLTLLDVVLTDGLLSELQCYRVLAECAGVELVDLETRELSPLAARLVPERVARRCRAVPIDQNNREIVYAIDHAFDADTDRDIAFAAGRQGHMVLARRSQLDTVLDFCYPKNGGLEEICKKLRTEVRVEQIDTTEENLPSGPVVELVYHIVARAATSRASDIHVEPSAEGAAVRYRIGGILETALTIPLEAVGAVTNRIKIMSKCDIANRQRPQDGAFRLKIGDNPVDVRVSTLPTIHGEKIVMRVIDSNAGLQTLDQIGYDAQTLTRLRQALNRPDGLVLVTGPTGSGKTTVLYGALDYLRTGRSNIVTVEDPVERQVHGVNQIPVNSKAGMTFATVLRSVLRQDPNVLMVGEIRDGEVAGIVGQAAYTGHLVLSTLHTADAASAITRLLNLGLEPFKIAESLTAVVAQRLVRQLCASCSVAGSATGSIEEISSKAGSGCDKCNGTGYGGRVPVVEVLVPDDKIRQAIARGATAVEIRQAMTAAGCPLIREYGIELVRRGVTSLEELNRVVSDDSAPAVMESRRSVLVVDDDPMQRRIARALLEREGLAVIEGDNGTRAIELARRERPDLLIIDLMMPQMNGFDAIARMRLEPALIGMPIIVLTAEEGPEIEKKVLDLGADDYLNKPIDAKLLLSRVRAIFHRSARAAA